MQKQTIILFCFIALAFGCVKSVSVDNENFTPVPIIVASLTHNEGFNARILITKKINESTQNTIISDAKIRLWSTDDNGKDIVIEDNFEFDPNSSSYSSKEPIATTVGNKYWIEIEMNQGKHYTSSVETMPKKVEISDVVYTKNELRAIFKDNKEETNYYFLYFSIYTDEMKSILIDNLKVVSNDFLINGNDVAYIGEAFFLDKGQYYTEVEMSAITNSSYLFYRKYIEQEEQNRGFSDESDNLSPLFGKSFPSNLSGNIKDSQTEQLILGQFILSNASNKSSIFNIK